MKTCAEAKCLNYGKYFEVESTSLNFNSYTRAKLQPIYHAILEGELSPDTGLAELSHIVVQSQSTIVLGLLKSRAANE